MAEDTSEKKRRPQDEPDSAPPKKLHTSERNWEEPSNPSARKQSPELRREESYVRKEERGQDNYSRQDNNNRRRDERPRYDDRRDSRGWDDSRRDPRRDSRGDYDNRRRDDRYNDDPRSRREEGRRDERPSDQRRDDRPRHENKDERPYDQNRDRPRHGQGRDEKPPATRYEQGRDEKFQRRDERDVKDNKTHQRPTAEPVEPPTSGPKKLVWGKAKKSSVATPATAWSGSFAEEEKQTKFLKLLGVKDNEIQIANELSGNKNLENKTEKMNKDLEFAYYAGLHYNKADNKSGLR